MNLAYWLNTSWMWSCWPESRAFERATWAVAATQQDVLLRMLARNAASEFGARYDFRSIHSMGEYQQRVPLATYDTYAASIERIANGGQGVLSADTVELFEPTSGTTSGEKLIPYTKTLRTQFQQAVSVWIADVMRQRPAVRGGRAYWSISPALGPTRTTPGGIPIGFDNDAAYLGRLEQLFLKRILIMPPAVTRLRSMENFQYCTLFHLLAADDMALISVWSPTYLTSLLAPLERWSERLCHDLRRGRARLPDSDDAGASESVNRVTCHAMRAGQTQRILCSNDSTAEKLRQLWPRLSLISCWADGTSANYLGELRALFPNVWIQPKGLLATEACISFPLLGQPGAVLALRSHFFEFIQADVPGDAVTEIPRLAHQLQQGRRYRVVVTTGGCLYRYQLGDVVEVVEFKNQCPLVRFVGRADRVCDQVGEKLDESHVSAVLHRVFKAHGLISTFSMLVPLPGSPAGYRLYLESDNVERIMSNRSAVTNDIEGGLRENPYYRHALRLGQLQALELCVVDPKRQRLWPLYERVCLDRGQNLGDIKPTAMDSWNGWSRAFESASIDAKGPQVPIAE